MSLISRLFDAVQSWRRRRGHVRTAKRAGVSMERLDHRQLLSVNFTGNVATDFPVSTTPGVVVLQDPNNTRPVISPDIAPIVKVSGLQIDAIRVSYTASDDTLSLGIEQPLSQQPGQPGPVVAGDVDNNGNDGTVNPAVTAIKGPQFQDFQNFGGSETMGIFLDLDGAGTPDIVAGYASNDPRSPKEYQVARAVVNGTTSSPQAPDFGTQLPQYEGDVYKNNSTIHPNLEFAIKDFSKLYLAETGQTLGPGTTIKLGAFANSGQDLGISEEYFHEQPLTIGPATRPPTCPPVSPPIYINPHSNAHVNTAHETLVRVNVLGSSGFDVKKIVPTSVTLGGAHPVFAFTRFINPDEWLDGTFVFKGNDINLPRGYTQATVTGELTDGTTFSSTVKVFNRDKSFYSPGAESQALGRQDARATQQNGFINVGSSNVAPTITASEALPVGPMASRHVMREARAASAATTSSSDWTQPPSATVAGPVVKIKQRVHADVAQASPARPHISGKLNKSIGRLAKATAADTAASAQPQGAA